MNRYTVEARELFRLALPLAAAQAGTQLMSVVDAAVVGRLGATQIGAVGLGNALFFAFSIIATGIVMGIDPLASQAIGSGDAVRARRVLWQGVWLSVATTFALSIPMGLSPLVLTRVGIDAAIVDQTRVYLWIRMLGLLPMLLFTVVRSYLQARGITRPMIIAMVLGNVFNFLADLLFVYGGDSLPAWSGPLRSVPALGIAGAGLSTFFGSLLQLAIVAEAVRRLGKIDADVRKPLRHELRNAFAIGLPQGLQFGAEVGIFALVGVLAGKLGSTELAAHQVVLTLASLTFTMAVGVGAAGSVRVGRAIGARDAAATRLGGVVSFLAGAGVMTISAAAFLLIPSQLARLLTNQREVIALAVPLFAVAAVFQLSDGTQAVGAGVLRGAADTRFAFVANVVGHWFVGLPTAILLGFTFGLGIIGLWWGLCAGLTAVALLLLIRFIRISSREITPV